MERHRTALGALFLVNGLLGVLGLLIVLAIFGFGGAMVQFAAAEDPDLPPLVPWIPTAVGLFIAGIIALFAVPCLIAAWGLFGNRSWSRTVSLIVGILNIMGFPLGTVTGVYAIWYFVQPDQPVSSSPPAAV